MNRITDYGKLATDITNWIKEYATQNNIKSLVVGVSGGIDSAVVSTLCAMTGLSVHSCTISIYSKEEHLDLASSHIDWLFSQYDNVYHGNYDLSDTFDSLCRSRFSFGIGEHYSHHTVANTKSRLRMTLLYARAGMANGIVVGTGNKVEDFGVGFYTKYGDGGVDISPIADLYKSEVRELGRYLGVSQDIINAVPTDGLWEDGRTDIDQLKATYEELEFVMENCIGKKLPDNLTERQLEVCDIYDNFHLKNRHKMEPIPIFKLVL